MIRWTDRNFWSAKWRPGDLDGVPWLGGEGLPLPEVEAVVREPQEDEKLRPWAQRWTLFIDLKTSPEICWTIKWERMWTMNGKWGFWIGGEHCSFGKLRITQNINMWDGIFWWLGIFSQRAESNVHKDWIPEFCRTLFCQKKMPSHPLVHRLACSEKRI